MARSITRQRVDDIDGSPAEHTVEFALDGQRFQIDLNDAHAAKLRDLFAPYISAGRTGGSMRGLAVKSGAAATTSAQRSRRRGARSSGPASTPDNKKTAEQRPAHVDASSSGPRAHRTMHSADAPEKPLAAVVQLTRRSREPMGPSEVAQHRHRLVAEMGELTRVVAVAMLAAAADRLVGVIVKPAVTAANGENAGRRIRGDTPAITASIVPGAPNSSAAPAG